ncbi:nose resistant to fluoxetine protein 6-like [Battus philenor]|uniref:nose resistant to fluoxetine protein 6-like n=1 Tax=Battus philenor TaxID=42288 RepID=UPI0035CEDD17
MKFTRVLFVLFYFYIESIPAQECKNTSNNLKQLSKHSYFDIIIEELLSHKWEADEKICLDQILNTIRNVKNSTLWATWIWDSTQLPVGHLYGIKYHSGSFDQCLRERVGAASPPFRTQYCLAQVTLAPNMPSTSFSKDIDPYAPTEEYIRSSTVLAKRFDELFWGVCVPHSCQATSVQKFVRSLLKPTHLGGFQHPAEVSIESCETAGDSKRQVNGFHIFLFAATFMAVVVLLSTKYVSTQKNAHSHSFATNVVKCFCLKRNVNDLVEIRENDLNSLHGIRCLSSFGIVLVHIIIYPMVSAVGNALDYEDHFVIYKPFVEILLMFVDTFFVMSGILFMRNVKNDGSAGNLIRLVIKRYFRLIWWYAVSLITIAFILPNAGCGPICSRHSKVEKNACFKSWWTGLLLVGNYVESYNVCNIVVWYIFCDFHLTIVSAILYWIHQRNRRLAISCFAILALLLLILPGRVVYNDLEGSKLPIDFRVWDNIRTSYDKPSFLLLYMNTHHRATPYLVGLAVGYIMTEYGIQAFNAYFKKRFVIALVTSIAFFAISLSFIPVDKSLIFALFLVTSRLVWAGMFCALIVACESGRLPHVKKLLAWSGFAMLGKLTYGIYIVHSITISYTYLSARTPSYYSGYVLTEKFLGNYTLATVLSLLFCLLVEAPLNNLVKLLLTPRKQDKGIEGSNGVGIRYNSTSSSLMNNKKEE